MIGSVLGNRYEILSAVGSGGMANVYKAKDRYLQRIVAVKLLKEEFREDSDFLKRFDTEAQAAASLTHPNIVQIYDIGSDNNRYYIVMEFVEGITLKEYIEKNESLDWKETAHIGLQISSALDKAHSRNIIHRDIKPNNIIMTAEGVPKVADFGIAHSVPGKTDTRIIDTIGSVHYSSPEQARGGYTDAQSDIYSIGVTMFEMITGTLPFDGDTPVAVALKHIQDSPPVPSSIKKDIPSAMDDIILTAMAKSKQERYNTVRELINDLENVISKSMGAMPEIILPNVKRENKFDTRKIENLREVEEVSKGSRVKNSLNSRTKKDEDNGGNSKSVVMPIIYIILIITILGSIYYFVSMIIKEFADDSNNPKEVTVGSYENRDIDEVIQELQANGIQLQYVNITREADDIVPENHIISQYPIADSKMKLGGYTTLDLVVSLGTEMIEIPTVVWQDHTTMKYRLEDDYNLVVDEVPQYHDEIAVNMSIGTNPEAGEKVKKGTKVTLYWSLGPEKKMVVVPELIGDTYEVALRKLTTAKLKVGDTYPLESEGNRGLIIDQSPKYGETVAEDTAITLFFEEEAPIPEEPGASTPPSGTEGKTITIDLPEGYSFAETVRLRVLITNNTLGEESTYTDQQKAVSEFPTSIIIPVNTVNHVTIRAYINDILAFEKIYEPDYVSGE